jgi:prefoldin subunit 5
LEDKNGTLPQLEQRRKHLVNHMKDMREELNQIDSKITQLKKQAKPEPQDTTKPA